MSPIFSGSEIVELGIQIEKNGRDFYNTLTSKSKNSKAKTIFKYLAGEEEKHIQVFQGLLDSVHKYQPREAYPQEYFAYMHALANDHIFTKKNKGAEIAKKTKNDLEAVGLGMGFEKDSIVFYIGMKKVAPDYDHKIIDALIEQEQNHLLQLLDLKRAIRHS